MTLPRIVDYDNPVQAQGLGSLGRGFPKGYQGRRLRARNERLATGERRVCEHPECGTILAAHNTGKKCATHS